MVFLPRNKYTISPDGIKVYKASEVRPLDLSNTFVKIIACTLKVLLCKVADQHIHHSQKCIAGRNILDNVILVDTTTHLFAIEKLQRAIAIFLDFVSAFPSLAHSFLWRALIIAGLPIQFIVAI